IFQGNAAGKKSAIFQNASGNRSGQLLLESSGRAPRKNKPHSKFRTAAFSVAVAWRQCLNATYSPRSHKLSQSLWRNRILSRPQSDLRPERTGQNELAGSD